MPSGWGRIPLLTVANYILGKLKYRVLEVYIDIETQELVIEYEVVK